MTLGTQTETVLDLIKTEFGIKSNTYKRVIAMRESAERWAEDLELDGYNTEIIILAATVMHIGKLVKVNKTNFSPYDGFKYLMDLGVDRNVCLLVLYQTYAQEVSKLQEAKIQYIYTKPLPDDLERAHKILSVVEFSLSNTGREVEIGERVLELIDSCDNNLTVVKSINEMSHKVAMWKLDLMFNK